MKKYQLANILIGLKLPKMSIGKSSIVDNYVNYIYNKIYDIILCN